MDIPRYQIMADLEKQENRCTECNITFETKEKLREHQANHSAVYCDTCPIDMAIRVLSKLFRRNKHPA